jgi:DNA-binding Lrp family transcriptional regulator
VDHGSRRITARDRLLLEFIAEHRLVLSGHVQALLGVSATTASRRLRALEQAGLIDREALFYRYPAHHRIRRRGLELIGSRLGAPKRSLNIAHDVGVAWLWLAAHRGAFGSLAEVVSERSMRSTDGTQAHAARVTGRSNVEPFGVRLSGQGPKGRSRLHYPDLLLVDRAGRRIAVELELTSKGRSRRHRIIGGYASDRRIDAVLYLVPDQRIAREVQAAARRFGSERTVIVQQVRMGAGQVPALGAAARREPARDAGRGPTAAARPGRTRDAGSGPTAQRTTATRAAAGRTEELAR